MENSRLEDWGCELEGVMDARERRMCCGLWPGAFFALVHVLVFESHKYELSISIIAHINRL